MTQPAQSPLAHETGASPATHAAQGQPTSLGSASTPQSASETNTIAQGPFTFPVRIYWEDTDAGGIVFYANYLKFFERARTEWLRALGIHQQTLREQTGGVFVVTDAKLRYLSPARLDDQLIVTASLAEAGRASLTIQQQAMLVNAHDAQAAPKLLCEGQIRIGWVDASSMRPARIPNRILEQLS